MAVFAGSDCSNHYTLAVFQLKLCASQASIISLVVLEDIDSVCIHINDILAGCPVRRRYPCGILIGACFCLFAQSRIIGHSDGRCFFNVIIRNHACFIQRYQVQRNLKATAVFQPCVSQSITF